MFQAVPLSIIRSFFPYTQQWYMSYRLQLLLASRNWGSVLILLTSCQQNLYDIYQCCVYNEKSPDDGQGNCPKHVEFHSKNKIEKLVNPVGFITRILSNLCNGSKTVMCFSLLIVEISRSHSSTHHTKYDSSRRVIGPSQGPLPENTQQSQKTDICSPFEAAITTSERPKTHALDRAATEIGSSDPWVQERNFC